MGFKFNPFTGTFDEVGAGSTTTPGGNDTEIQYNDSGAFAGSADLTWDDTGKVLEIGGDINLDDGGTYETTLQVVTPTAARTISFPDATGTVALVAGSSGQLLYNNAGVNAGVPSSVVGATGNITLSLNGATGVAPVAVTGTWFAGTTPQVLIQPSNVGTAGSWSASGTGIGVNAVTGFGGNLLDLQVNGTSAARIDSSGNITASNFRIGSITTRFRGDGSTGIYVDGATTVQLSGYSDNGVNVGGNSIGWGTLGLPPTTKLFGGSQILEQRNAANAQTFRVYGTYTDASNHVRAALSSTSTAVTLAAETAGTGADDIPLNLTAAGTGTIKVNSVAEVVVSSTVAGLPAAPVVGMLTRVTDATAPVVGMTVAGGGAAAALVWYNGANWSVIGV